MSQNDIEQIELSIEEAQKMVERKERALRLADNPDFKSLILDGYFKDEAIRLTHLLSDPNAVAHRPQITESMVSIGSLKRYLHAIVQMGAMAEQEISEARETLDEIRGEEIVE